MAVEICHPKRFWRKLAAIIKLLDAESHYLSEHPRRKFITRFDGRNAHDPSFPKIRPVQINILARNREPCKENGNGDTII